MTLGPDYILQLGGRTATPMRSGDEAGATRRFLGIWFRCCHVYGRLYRNRVETRYEGRCPSCGARVHAVIGPGGTGQRMFEAR